MTEEGVRKLHNLLRASETAIGQVWQHGEDPKEWVAITHALVRRAIGILEEEMLWDN